jgi:GNAT superfamily N-acetyltransferase
MPTSPTVRPIRPSDLDQWLVLWAGYNAFYGREGATALREDVTHTTWQRFFEPAESVRALVAEDRGRVVGLAHVVFHRSTTRLSDVCYLQDLFTDVDLRGRGIGRRLIEAVYETARDAGCTRVYWQTKDSNAAARALYERVAEFKGFIVYSSDF